MNEALVTMVGNVATPVSFAETSARVPRATFRLAATERRFDSRQGAWVDVTLAPSCPSGGSMP